MMNVASEFHLGFPIMSTAPSPNETSGEASSAAPVSRSPWERLLIGLVVAGTVGLIIIAIGQSIGLDLLTTASRWGRVRKLNPQIAAEPVVIASNSDAQPRSTYLGSQAADAQISPPRRKNRAADNIASVDTPKEIHRDAGAPDAVDHDRGKELPISLPDEPPMTATTGMTPKPPEAQSDYTEELLDAAAQLVNQSWQDFEYPVRWGVAESSKPRMIYSGSRNRLLKAIASNEKIGDVSTLEDGAAVSEIQTAFDELKKQIQ